MAAQALDVTRRSATTTPPPGARRTPEVAKLIDISQCIGCKACQVACMEWNDLRGDIGTNVGVYDNPSDLNEYTWTLIRFTEVENGPYDFEWLIRKDGCLHCGEPGCLKACPSPGAIIQHSNGIVDFQQQNCIGCGYCVTGCPFNIPRISRRDEKAYKCSMCSDRISVGLEPVCAKTCPTGAIHFGSKEMMIRHADARIADLNSRGFMKAGLYDPLGVGGTHVMYVLPHADQPEKYGLPRDPQISPWVEFWKGISKPLGLAMLGLTAIGAFFHFIKVGPNEAEVEDVPETKNKGKGGEA